MNKKLHILFVEDEVSDYDLIEGALHKAKITFIPKRVETSESFQQQLMDFKPDLILSDYSLPSFDGMSALRLAKKLNPSIPFIIVTGSVDEETAAECIKAGADDYVLKDHLARLGLAVRASLDKNLVMEEKDRAIERLQQSEKELRLISHALISTKDAFTLTDLNGNILFVNPAFCEIYGYVEQELRGKNISLIHALGNSVEVLEQISLATLNGGWYGELLNRRKDGREFPVELWTSVVQNDEGKKVALTGVARDITLRKKTEEELRRTEAEFRTLVEQSLVGVYIIQDGKFAYVNPKIAETFGYTSEEIVNSLKVSDLVYEEDRPVVIENLRKRLDGHIKSLNYTFRGKQKNGSLIHVEVFGSETEYKGKPAIIGTLLDITERKRAEEIQNAVYRIAQAADSAKHLDDLFGSVHEIVKGIMPAENFYIALYDDIKNIISFPYFVDEVDTASPPQKPGKGLTEYVLRTGRSLLCNTEIHQELMRRGEAELVGVPSPIWLGTPLIIDGKTIGVMVVQHYSDEKAYGVREQQILEYVSSQVAQVIYHKRAEESLRGSEERYRRFFEEDLTGYFVSTPDGGLLDCNPRFAEMLGFTSIDDLLQSGTDMLYMDQKEYVALLNEKGKLENYERTLIKKDGTLIHVIANVIGEFDSTEKLTKIHGYVFDITERKMLEDQLRQAQKMESIGILAGGVAHDFNNILGIILGYVTLLETGKASSDQSVQSIDAIKKATERGARLVQQLLTFARKTDATLKSVIINDVISELVKMLSHTLPKTITISTRLAANVPSIIGDPGQLHQALLNLCLNAKDAMIDRSFEGYGGGTLSLATGIIMGDGLPPGITNPEADEYVYVTVLDTGIGMDDATKSRIFEPFFTTKELGKGTGLGLSVVYGVINNHQGFVDVQSEIGRGTSVTLYLPVPKRKAEVLSARAKESIEVRGGKETILIVEDEEMLSELMKVLLEEKGYTVLIAGDGIQAVELYKRHHDQIALVLSDMGLPKLGGWDAFRQMKEINPNIKGILASGYFDPKLKTQMLKEGAKDFIQKPYVPDEILKRIREVIEE